MSNLTRRAALALLAGAGPAAAEAPLTSLIPEARPYAWDAPAKPAGPRDILAEVNLPGKTTFAVADARTGELLGSANDALRLPPASVSKAVTAQYALEAFGSAHQFVTRVISTGAVEGGVVKGDLILAGGGDPMLDSDDLETLSKELKKKGIRRIEGRFLVHRGGVARVARIDGAQPVHLGYNPAVSGLNLNFNRVYFEWKKAEGGYQVRMDARGTNVAPIIPTTRMKVVEGAQTVFAFAQHGEIEQWSVSKSALGDGGARWLPVRNPALYAGYAFQGICRENGIILDKPQLSGAAPNGRVLAVHRSMPLERIVRSMLYYSTNVIAEVLGLMASRKRGYQPANLSASARLMGRWAAERFGTGQMQFVDHSGLGDKTRVSAKDLVRILVGMGPDGVVAAKMRKHHMPKDVTGVDVVAKTGTLNFVSGLAGFAKVGGRDLAFAILSADLPRRNALTLEQREKPRGAKGWSSRARYQEHQLLAEWARQFAGNG